MWKFLLALVVVGGLVGLMIYETNYQTEQSPETQSGATLDDKYMTVHTTKTVRKSNNRYSETYTCSGSVDVDDCTPQTADQDVTYTLKFVKNDLTYWHEVDKGTYASYSTGDSIQFCDGTPVICPSLGDGH